ncbi:MAG: ATP-binding cassette domain-containing protein [Candidatus Paceibacterota bacterium]
MIEENDKKIDPVCGMYLDDFPDLKKISHNGRDYLFCGEGCAKRFELKPEKFLGQPIIKIRSLRKHFGMGESKTDVLRSVDLNIWPGDFVAIIGASGSGKSTLLNMIGLLDWPNSGKIFIKGRDTENFGGEERALLRTKTFGFVFQQYNLIPWLSVYDNIVLPMIFSGENVKLKDEQIKRSIEQVGLTSRVTHRPYELSGGEQQRVALLRALANDPEIIIGDEPTGNLDSKTGNEILKMLIELNQTQGKTLIIVTHDADIAEQAEEVIVLKDGQIMRDQRIHQKIYAE